MCDGGGMTCHCLAGDLATEAVWRRFVSEQRLLFLSLGQQLALIMVPNLSLSSLMFDNRLIWRRRTLQSGWAVRRARGGAGSSLRIGRR